ncbi:uncharacterized protein NPIL_660751 [Nephila pilipes]|uniref:Uncharacterized protein n=1 Tax=Nephila pilipes TaxID=299642 RepID=A0A8X6T3E0_NEPPI|nr:uncharacterized protein NPIL_660751 [Nephila pilipes]
MNYENELLPILFVVVSKYMQQDKYAVTTFSRKVVDKVKKCKPKFSMKEIVYQSDGDGKHLKRKFSICLGTIIYEEFQWHFTATSHSKGAIDGLGGALKLRMREATLPKKIDPHTVEEFVTFTKNYGVICFKKRN